MKDGPFASMKATPTDHISPAAVIQCCLVSSSTDQQYIGDESVL